MVIDTKRIAGMREMALRFLLIGIWLSSLLGLATGAQASPQRGYQPRPCGFDLNDNGITGEPQDCNICDGVTLDPDGDGINEDLIYVDAQQGSDTRGDGSPQNPYQTLSFAMSQTDGSSDGAEDILCLTGRHIVTERLMLSTNGVAGSKPAFGNIEIPINPFMIVGWDKDNDGDYPPYDSDDIAILDGDNFGVYTPTAFQNRASYIEIAHLEARNFGRGPDVRAKAGGFLKPNGVDGLHHIYLHDLELTNILRERLAYSSAILFDVFSGRNLTHFTVANTLTRNYGSYWLRGACPDCGSWLIKNNTIVAYGDTTQNTYSYVSVFKPWDALTNVDILDNIFDSNAHIWNSQKDTGTALIVNVCTQDITIRNNDFRDWKLGVYVTPFSNTGVCRSRPVDNIVIDRNIYRNTYAWNSGFAIAVIHGDNSDSPIETSVAENIVITNNQLLATEKLRACVLLRNGNNAAEPTGTITVVGNTCVAPVDFAGILVDGINIYRHQNFYIENNIFDLTGTGKNIRVNYTPSGWDANYNVYTPNQGYIWNGTNYNALDDWLAASGGDANSKECIPEFVSSTDSHLSETDTCAMDSGTTLTGFNTDYDGDTRPQGAGWDIGADEYVPIGVCSPGDINCDGAAGDSSDIQLVVNVRLGLVTDPAIIQRADLNSDTKVDAADIQAIVNMRLGA